MRKPERQSGIQTASWSARKSDPSASVRRSAERSAPGRAAAPERDARVEDDAGADEDERVQERQEPRQRLEAAGGHSPALRRRTA